MEYTHKGSSSRKTQSHQRTLQPNLPALLPLPFTALKKTFDPICSVRIQTRTRIPAIAATSSPVQCLFICITLLIEVLDIDI